MSSSRSVGELAELVGGICHGDPDALIQGVADLHGAGPSEISFFAHPRYESAARQTRAGALVVDPQTPKD
jgi:UDP-3-O-[3-hydroxymyristoyl] glucosamine N-acyltransferase